KSAFVCAEIVTYTCKHTALLLCACALFFLTTHKPTPPSSLALALLLALRERALLVCAGCVCAKILRVCGKILRVECDFTRHIAKIFLCKILACVGFFHLFAG